MEEDQGQNLFNVRILTFFFSECQIFHNYEIRVRILKKQQQKKTETPAPCKYHFIQFQTS